MGIIYIENRTFAIYESRFNPRDIKDVVDIVLTPQKQPDNRALKPEVTFAFANAADRLFLIYIALKDNGQYYFGYSIHLDQGGMTAYPSENSRRDNGYDTIIGCVTAALKYCGTLSFYSNTPPDIRLVNASKEALRLVNKLRLRQMTIFDML